MDKQWHRITDTAPDDHAQVWYYFDLLGVFAGRYESMKDTTFGRHCFIGSRGYLIDDVTHWMPREDGDEQPAPPIID
jgi:hypothetical protein